MKIKSSRAVTKGDLPLPSSPQIWARHVCSAHPPARGGQHELIPSLSAPESGTASLATRRSVCYQPVRADVRGGKHLPSPGLPSPAVSRSRFPAGMPIVPRSLRGIHLMGVLGLSLIRTSSRQ